MIEHILTIFYAICYYFWAKYTGVISKHNRGPAFSETQCISLMVIFHVHRVSKKLCQCYFVSNSVKHWPNLIIFGMQHREET